MYDWQLNKALPGQTELNMNIKQLINSSVFTLNRQMSFTCAQRYASCLPACFSMNSLREP